MELKSISAKYGANILGVKLKEKKEIYLLLTKYFLCVQPSKQLEATGWAYGAYSTAFQV
jgi:hypothetical protein